MSSQTKRTAKKVTKYHFNKPELEQLIAYWVIEQRKKSFFKRLKLALIIMKKAK